PLITYYKVSTRDLMAVHCANNACTSSTIHAVDTTGDVGRGSSVTLAPPIHSAPDGPTPSFTIPAGPVIAYYDATNHHLKVARCTDAACASAPIILTLDTADDAGTWTSIATSVNGTPIVSYHAVASDVDQMRVVYCGSNGED